MAFDDYDVHRRRSFGNGWSDDPWEKRTFDPSGYDRSGFDRFGRDRFGRTLAERDKRLGVIPADPRPWRGIDIETLPTDLTRQLCPHYRDWIVIDPEKTRYRRLGEDTRLFVEGKKGWEPVSSFSCLAIAQKHYAVARRQTQAHFEGGGFFRPVTRESLHRPRLSAADMPPAEIFMPITDVGPVARHSLDVEILPGVHPTQGRLIFSGSGNYRVQRSVSTDSPDALFGHLEEDGAYSLTASWERNNKAVFEGVPFDVLAQPGALREQLMPILDEEARLYILDHRLRGERPLLRAGWEAPQFGIFADGTGNNAHNDMADETKAPTNVAKLFELYPRIADGLVDRYYIDGIGTRTGQEASFSDLLDQGIAHSFGERVGRAISRMRRFFEDFPLAPFGYIDLFGFSRGSAMARALVNAIHHLSATDPGTWGGLRVVVRFVGLFDTVGSVGRAGNNSNDNRFARAGMPGPIILDLHPDAARAVFHLTAKDERRRNFPLSSIRGADGSLPAHFTEEAMPGAHADIGGGYRTGPEVVNFPPRQITWLRPEERDRQIDQALVEMQQQFQAPGLQIEPELVFEGVHQGPWQRSIIAFRAARLVRADLAHIALERMHAAATANGVPLLPLAELGGKGRSYRVPDELRALLARAEQAGPGSPDYDALYSGYIHHSHQYHRGQINGTWREGAPNLINSNSPNPNGRTIFPNDPERGNHPADPWQSPNRSQHVECI